MAKLAPNYDKEEMFRKIMPSATFLDHETPAPGETLRPDSAPAPAEPKDILLRKSGVNVTKKSDEQILVNVVEFAVIEKLDQAFTRFNCCKCDKCRKDAAAVALNALKTKYVVVEESRLNIYVALVNSTDVTNAVIKAILQVRDNPRH